VEGSKMLPFQGLPVNNANVYWFGKTVTRGSDLQVEMFRPHANLGDEVNHNIVQSEIEGGVFLNELQPRTILQIHTQHHCYTAVFLGDNQALIWDIPSSARNPFRSPSRDRLGRDHAESALRRARHAARVSPPGVPNAHRHLPDPGNQRAAASPERGEPSNPRSN